MNKLNVGFGISLAVVLMAMGFAAIPVVAGGSHDLRNQITTSIVKIMATTTAIPKT